MLSGNKISIKHIIAKVYQDLDLTSDAYFDDIIEWAATALDFIGSYQQVDHITTKLQIRNYRAELPEGFISAELVKFNNSPVLYSLNTTLDNSYSGRYYTPYSYNQHKIQNATFVNGMYYTPSGDGFKIENGWLKTTFKEGEIELTFTGIPLDEEGFPLVPNDKSFIEALYWFVVYKISFIQLRRGEISGAIYTEAKNQWHWYCNQAGAQAMMPDLATLEGIKRSYLSLLYRPNMYQNFFKDLNKLNGSE